jgi:TatD DNase family protein
MLKFIYFLIMSLTTNRREKLGYSSQLCPCCYFDQPNFLPFFLLQANEDSTASDGGAMLSPLESLEKIKEYAAVKNDDGGEAERTKGVWLVDTHGHPQLNQESDGEKYQHDADTMEKPAGLVVELACAVSPNDWQDTLAYAAQSPHIRPALGVHPWYLEDLPDGWLHDLETLLRQHSRAVVGEIGLCKMARFLRTFPEGKQAALKLQRQVFLDQFQLAARLKRPVSVHCVDQHGVFLIALQELRDGLPPSGTQGGEPKNEDDTTLFPPAIAMHSFTGTAHHVKKLLEFETTLQKQQTNVKFYFGFSHIVNVDMSSSEKSRRQGREAIRAVPRERLVAESDVHSAGNVAAGTAGAVSYLAFALEEPLQQVAERVASNGLAFLNTGIPTSTDTAYSS